MNPLICKELESKLNEFADMVCDAIPYGETWVQFSEHIEKLRTLIEKLPRES